MPARKEYLRLIVAKVKTAFEEKWSEKLLVVCREEVLDTSSSILSSSSMLTASHGKSFIRPASSINDSFSTANNNNTCFVYTLEIHSKRTESVIQSKLTTSETSSEEKPTSTNNSFQSTGSSTSATSSTSGTAQQNNPHHGIISGVGKRLLHVATHNLQPKKRFLLSKDIRVMSAQELTNRQHTLILFFEHPLYIHFRQEEEYVEWFDFLAKVIHTEETSVKQGICAIIESITDACVVSDADGIITGFNTQAEKLFGYSKEEVVDKGVNVSILMPDSYAKYHQQILTRYNKHRNRVPSTPAQLENETCHDPRVEQDETCLQEPVPFVENQETNGCGMIETIDSDGIKEVLKSLIHTIFFRTEVRNEISIFRKEVATDLSNLRMDVTNISNNIDTLYELAILPYMTEDKAYEVKSPYKLDCCLITKDPIEEQEWTNKLLELKSQKLLEHYEKLQYETDFVEINFLKIKKEDRKCVQIFEATISNLKHGGMLLTKLVQLERQVMMFSKIHPSHTIECIGLVSTGENPKIKETVEKHQNILSITWKMLNEGKFKYLQRGHSVGIR